MPKAAISLLISCVVAVLLFIVCLPIHKTSSASGIVQSPKNVRGAYEFYPPSRILFGIFSMDSEEERHKRDLIRNSYLSFKDDPRICSLATFLERTYQNAKDANKCLLIYTFVIGGNPNGSTELMDDSHPITLDPSAIANAENDATYLNIRENMEEGKSQTWFKFATKVMDLYDMDYVSKCDSDSLVFVPSLFEFAKRNLPPAPYNQRIYVGKMYDLQLCGGLDKPHCLAMKGRAYMVGQLYILSADLVYYITSDQVDRKGLSVGFEDYDIGRMVLSNPHPIKMIPLLGHQKFWRHPLKSDEEWMNFWGKYLQRSEQGQARIEQ
jgi:hypothetical protein